MPEKEVQILIEGEDAEAVALEMAGLIRETLGHETRPRAVQPGEAGKDDKVDSSTVMSAIAILLSIPSTMLAVTDLIERLRKKKHADKLIDEAQNLQRRHPATIIRVRGGRDGAVRIETIDGNALIDIANGPDA